VKVTRLALTDYRNIASAVLEPSPRANIIHGDNAQGKTNLLEAVWLFAGARSFRGGKDTELVRFDAETASLELFFEAEGREQTARLAFGRDKKKVMINDIPEKSASALAGRFLAVVFSPDQLSMVKQGPDQRRRFLDMSLCQIIPKYQKALDSYERILRQRARLLRDSAHHAQLLDMLEDWDHHLVRYGAYISEVRARYVRRLYHTAKSVYDGIASGKEALSLAYQSSAAEQEPEERGAWEKILAEALKRNRAEDLRMGFTTVGPHRDDLLISVDGVSARSFASQGQQRSCVLALKLAECELMRQSAGEQPVVLLDDVMSELDEGRRAYLLNHLQDRQVFITCCEAGAFEAMEEGKVFHIKEGRCTP